MKKVLIIALCLVVALFGLWFWRVHQIKAFVANTLANVERFQGEDFTFEHGDIETRGFPFYAEVALKYPHLNIKVEGEKAFEGYVDGELIVATNLLATKVWLKSQGNRYFMYHNPGNKDKGSVLLIASGAHGIEYTPEHYNFVHAIPVSLAEGDFKAVLYDIAQKGQISGTNMVNKIFFFPERVPMREAVKVKDPFVLSITPEYNGAWHISRDKEKGLDQFIFSFETTNENPVVKQAKISNEDIPDPGITKTTIEAEVSYDPEISLSDPFKLLGSLQNKPFSFVVNKFNSANKFEFGNLSFYLKTTTEENNKIAVHFVLNDESKSSFETHKIALYQLKKTMENYQKQESKLPPEVAAKLIPVILEVFPRFYELGPMKTTIDLSLDMGGGLIPFMVNQIDLKNFNWESEQYGFKINADFRGPLEGFVGKANITFLNYRGMLERLAMYYNTSHTSFEKVFGKEPVNAYAPPLSSKSVENLIALIRKVSNEPNGVSKDATIVITNTENGFKVGPLPLEQFLLEAEVIGRQIKSSVLSEEHPTVQAAPEQAIKDVR